jgi:hypothetical protein
MSKPIVSADYHVNEIDTFEMPTPEEMWDKFIKYLNKTQPIGRGKEPPPHQNFIGSIKSYRDVFIAANSEE